jgi:hypothetical protein
MILFFSSISSWRFFKFAANCFSFKSAIFFKSSTS